MHNKEYKIVNGTFYDQRTPDNVIRVLEECRNNRTRIKIDLGDIQTGQSWKEVYDTTGKIGRSTGSIKVPLLIHNSRSMGGPAILDHCIIKIELSRGKKVLYQHENYKE